jgi:hypothetical protein
VKLETPGMGNMSTSIRQLLDYAIAKGEGGVYLRLSPEQYCEAEATLARQARSQETGF